MLAGRYRIAGLLGRGGMGEVYRATDLTLGQVVALKFLPEATARDERALARFYNEVRIARQVAHPNVCRVYDIGQVEGLHYISMEYVDGEDLGSLDQRGAIRMSAWLFACLAASTFLGMHHTATAQELSGFWRVVGQALINAGFLWVCYLALEPWVRRYWPHTMISWTRYTTRGFRDPLVGRDLLYGAACGAMGSVLGVLETAQRRGEPSLPSLGVLSGVRYEFAQMLSAVPSALLASTIYLLMLFLLRVLLRKQWIAGPAFVLIMSVIPSIGSATLRLDIMEGALFFGAVAFVLLRFGLLAAIAAYGSYYLLATFPPTLDLSVWYIGLVPIPLLTVAAMAIYGFRTSLAGRPLFQISGE